MGTPEGLRSFCVKLREFDPAFNGTDFKITDGLEASKLFKGLTIRKTEEIVAYGLGGELAPSLHRNQAKHVPADQYHSMMTEKDTVIIDVRNAYESAIGHFQPPPGGATLIDPKMRNSHEFPKWLNAPETKAKLHGKRVMMYCTGGIRCERASALLTQMSEVSEDIKPKEIVMVRGGIERYMQTFPEGGYWKGTNYLFDKRWEQRPELKDDAALAKDIESNCCLCKTPWAQYRGQFNCSVEECKVPVIVCTDCQGAATDRPEKLKCPLCIEGFHLRNLAKPELRTQKRLLAEREAADPETAAETAAKRSREATLGVDGGGGVAMPTSGVAAASKKRKPVAKPSTRLFVGKLPLAVDAAKVKTTIGGNVSKIQWLMDRETKLFYGSVFVEMATLADATRAVEQANDTDAGMSLNKRRLRVAYAPPKADEVWPPADFVATDRPQVAF
jgi:predicted sulfurtransferase